MSNDPDNNELDKKTVLTYFDEVFDEAPLKPELLPKASIIDAQQLFMAYTPVVEIARETGVPMQVLRDLVYGKDGWAAQRKVIQSEVTEQVRQKARKRFQKGLGISIRLITKGLTAFEKDLQRKNRAPTLEEVDLLTSVAQRLDRTNILKETDEDSKKKSYGPGQLLKAIANDPYMRKALQIAGEDNKEMYAQIEEEFENEDTGSLANPR